MPYNPLGNSGLAVSAIGIGCNNSGLRVDEETTGQVVGAASWALIAEDLAEIDRITAKA